MKNESVIDSNKYDWVDFYKEFSLKLLNYKNDRRALIEKLELIFKNINEKIPTLSNDDNLSDIDPFTVFGLFNKQSKFEIQVQKRIKILNEIKRQFGIKSKTPTSFDAIPTLDPRNATYYPFDEEQKKIAIEKLWIFYELAILYADNKKYEDGFKNMFDDVLKIKQNALGKITMGLFWINPNKYVDLDGRGKWFIYDSGKISNEIVEQLPDSEGIASNEYIQIIDVLNKGIKEGKIRFSNFLEISDEAYNYSEEINRQNRNADINEKNTNDKIKNKFLGKNIIVYGVPGSGKSGYIDRILHNIPDDRKERIIFYPEYTYYDFVGQQVPTKDGSLNFQPGNFSKILKKALEDSNKDYYLIIEELNRGNAEAIFGDVFQLLDRKNGRSEYTIDNTNLKEYLKYSDDMEIYIPSNLTIYATINNSDQNVFNFDTAFSRRWDYMIMPCNTDKNNRDRTDNEIFNRGYIKGTNIKWNTFRMAVNDLIIQNKDNIFNAEEKRIGLYYIDQDCLSLKKNDEDDVALRKFSSKIFRYLYLNAFRNNENLIFNNTENNTLEDYILVFEKNKDIHQILNITIKENNSNRK